MERAHEYENDWCLCLPWASGIEKKENPKMLTSRKQSAKSRSMSISTAEAFHRVFRALPKKDRLTVVRYILEDEDIRRCFGILEIPNETTLEAFAEGSL